MFRAIVVAGAALAEACGAWPTSSSFDAYVCLRP
jgi:hypothetical protein